MVRLHRCNQYIMPIYNLQKNPSNGGPRERKKGGRCLKKKAYNSEFGTRKFDISCHLQMVVILQPASRRPFSMLPVTIFTVMMNNCQPDAKSSYFLPISFVVEFANGFKKGGEEK